jgi:phytol kinase
MDEAADLLLIPVLITGIGDGLAEPVGKRWGRHKYKARGLCSSKKYTRSYEGSATVLVSGWISCAAFYNYFGNWQHFVITIIVLPPLMTLAEAFSPHTWDTPFLMLTGVGFIWGVTMIPFH